MLGVWGTSPKVQARLVLHNAQGCCSTRAESCPGSRDSCQGPGANGKGVNHSEGREEAPAGAVGEPGRVEGSWPRRSQPQALRLLLTLLHGTPPIQATQGALVSREEMIHAHRVAP